jgi:ubiquinone biosynthesis monooxygenase Coq7
MADGSHARVVSRILRVNHAGEFGAIRIYQAQIAMTRWRAPSLLPPLCGILGQEKRHLERFRSLMPARDARPCGALPLWGLGGSVLGLVTGSLGREAVLVCTEAVERTVHFHLQDQLAWLAATDAELSTAIAEIMTEELGHLAFAREGRQSRGAWTAMLDRLVAAATAALIWLSTYGALGRMQRDLQRTG